MTKQLCALSLAAAMLAAACSSDGTDSPGGGSGGRGGGGGAGNGGSIGTGGSPGTGGRGGSGGGSGGTAGGSGGASGGAGGGGAGGAAVDSGAAGSGGSGARDAGDARADGGGTDGGGAGPTPPSAGGMNVMVGVRTSLLDDIKGRWVGERRAIKEEDGATVFTGTFQANQFGGPRGHTVRVPLKTGKEYILEYRIRFDGENFPFTRGGKIPGLAGGNAPTGCVNVNPQGFSARMMWRGGGGDLVGYIYDQTQSSACGNNISTNFSFKSNTWASIKERVRVNTGNASDGILQVWADGRMLIDRSNMRYMGTQSNNINTILFHFFFGGSTAAWAPSRTCSISVSDVFVTLVAE